MQLLLGILAGILVGILITRRIMAPSFCPDCIRRKQWEKELLQEVKTEEEKAQSRHYYGLRKKDKEK